MEKIGSRTGKSAKSECKNHPKYFSFHPPQTFFREHVLTDNLHQSLCQLGKELRNYTAARRGGLTSKIFRTQNLSIFSQHMHWAIEN